MLIACEALLQWQTQSKKPYSLLSCSYNFFMLHEEENATLRVSQTVW